MIELIEETPTNKSTCYECKKIIGKGTIRGIENYQDDYHHTCKRFYCYSCTLKRFKEILKLYNHRIIIIKKLQERNKSALKKQNKLRLINEL